VDTILGPEMKSTGEVMGIDSSFGRAFAKSQLAAGQKLPLSGTVFVSVRDEDKPALLEIVVTLCELGFKILGTRGTAIFLSQHGISIQRVNKVREGRPHAVDMIKNGQIDLVINTTNNKKAVSESYTIRRAALVFNIPYTTTIAAARATAFAIRAIMEGQLEVKAIQDYQGGSKIDY
jgi:carbamoyl-phosphate synthase large subunit